MELIDEVRKVFATDAFATKLAGITIDAVGTDYAKCSMAVTSDHVNAEGFTMGGAIFTLADFCFAVAGNVVNSVTITLSTNINFLTGTKASALFAESKCDKRGKTLCFFTTTITDERGAVIAIATANGYKRPTPSPYAQKKQ